MAYRFGTDYLIEIKEESAYGTAPSFASGAAVLADIIEMKPSREAIQIRLKNPTMEPRDAELLGGRRSGRVTMKGDLSPAHEILLMAYFNHHGSPYQIGATHQPTSYAIRQYFPGDRKGHQATGCVLESLKITGEGDRAIQYEAVWRARSIESELDFSTDGGGSIELPPPKPFLFADVDDISLYNGAYTDLNSLTLSLSREFADDNAAFQCAMLKQREFLTGFSGELALETLYNTVALNSAGWLEDHLVSDSLTAGKTCLSFMSNTTRWDVTAQGKITEVNPADPDKQVFVLSATIRLLGAGSNPALNIAVDTV
jgi:hypothetical protein